MFMEGEGKDNFDHDVLGVNLENNYSVPAPG